MLRFMKFRCSRLSSQCLFRHNVREFVCDMSSLSAIKMAYNLVDLSKGSIETSPIVIMHGLFGSKSNWQSLSKALSQRTGKKVLSVDARNHGNSPHSDEISYSHLAGDLRYFVDDLALHKVCMIGHSMGGRASMMFALQFPEYVEKLVVVDISPLAAPVKSMSAMSVYFEAMKSLQVPPSLTSSEGRKFGDAFLAKFITDSSIRQFLLTNLVKTDQGIFKWRMNLEVIERCFNEKILDFPAISLRFEKPTLFIGGLKSDYLKKEHESQILEIFPSAQFKYLPTGHWVHAEQPEEFIKLVNDFIS